MSVFIEDFSEFLVNRRNSVLDEARENSAYAELKSKSTKHSERLLASVPKEHVPLVISYFDALTGISSYETKYCYLRGLLDGDEPEVQWSPTSEAVPDELASHEQYSQEQATVISVFKELEMVLGAENLAMLNECRKMKATLLGIEKTYCYPGGLRDRKSLGNQLNLSADELQALLAVYL